MIECEPLSDIGVMRITTEQPNGPSVFARKRPGELYTTMRGGTKDVTTGGVLLDDTEAPFSTDLTYRVTLNPTDRLIQRNLVPTPRFLHGVQGWAAGTGRTLTVVPDSSANTTAAVGRFSSGSGTLAAPPLFVGNVNTTGYLATSYTLTPPTTGGTAVATNDWVFLIHTQLASVATPADPAGWTLIRTFLNGTRMKVVVYKRKWVGGDVSVTMAATSGSVSQGTLVWVRNASDVEPIFGPTYGSPRIIGSTVYIDWTTAINPSLVITVAAVETATTQALPTTTTGGTFRYALGTTPNTRSVVIASESNTVAGASKTTTVTYGDVVNYLVGFQMVLQNTSPLANRVFAKAKITPLTAAPIDPYVLTGRFRFTSTDVWIWDNVKTQGTWLNLRNTKATWAAVKSATVVGAGENYARVFVAIVNPTDGSYYVPPVMVRGVSDTTANQWLDFSMYFNTGADIPDTAEIWFIHGAAVREYIANWHLDEVGITNPEARIGRDPLYFFDGDTVLPTNSAERRGGEVGWVDNTGDARIGWEGEVGNSRSYYNGPTVMAAETTCQLVADPDERNGLCEPVLLSDPVSVPLTIWCSLISIDKITHPSTAQIYDIIGRSDPVAVSQVRGWEVGSLNLKTDTLQEREQLLGVMKSGRVILLRNPDPAYPENNWYLAIGQISEDRTLPDHRQPLRNWQVPFVRVARPAGLIEGSTAQTWAGVKALGTWDYVRTTSADWLDLATTVTS